MTNGMMNIKSQFMMNAKDDSQALFATKLQHLWRGIEEWHETLRIAEFKPVYLSNIFAYRANKLGSAENNVGSLLKQLKSACSKLCIPANINYLLQNSGHGWWI